LDSTSGLSPGAPNGGTTDLIANPNVATTKLPDRDAHHAEPLHLIVNDPAIAQQHSTTLVTPAAAVRHDVVSTTNDKNCNTSTHDENVDVPLENSVAINRDGQLLDGVPSVSSSKKKVPARRQTATAKGNRGEEAENVGLREKSLAGSMATSAEGDNKGRNGRKRKATGNPAGEEGSVDGKRSRRKVVLPSHLKETGYTAPKKGSRGGKKTK
jgi:hypothetical protein